MDVIGNNIANVNTHGFKSQRVTFADAMYQRIAAASADNPTLGRAGRNPQQIGLGVSVAGIDNIMVQGTPQRTDNPLDMTIMGEGFFVVSDDSGTYFTRAGNIQWNGRTFSINGRQLMGWNAVIDPVTRQTRIQEGSLSPMRTPPEFHVMNPTATTRLDFEGNLNAQDTPVTVRPMRFFDSLGNEYTIDVRFTWVPPGVDQVPQVPAGEGSDHANSFWRFEFLDRNGNPSMNPYIFPDNRRDMGRPVTLGVNSAFYDGDVINWGTGAGADGNEPVLTSPTGAGFINFNPDGEIQSIGNTLADARTAAAGGIALVPAFALNFLTSPPPNPLHPPAIIGGRVPVEGDIPINTPGTNIGINDDGNNGSIILDFRALTQWGEMHTHTLSHKADGNPPGHLNDIMAGPDGIITGRFTNGFTRVLGQVPVAKFLNPAGLERVGNTLFRTSANSGPFDGVGRHGEFMPGTLEMSNVDLANEFTEMITTQRGFQANSRIITTSDDMLQELVNLRR